MKNANAYGCQQAKEPLAPMTISRRDVNDTDVAFDVLYCGMCHSDLHQINNDWGFAMYPMVPGHEIIGRVTEVGKAVTKFKAGQIIGVGCLVDSCRQCTPCKQDLEQHCEAGMVMTYSSEDPISGGPTFGGYSNYMVVNQDFVLSIDDKLDPAKAAPLLCAGITTYSPLKRANLKPGSVVAIAGLGGLGHIAVKIAKAMQYKTLVLSRTSSKANDALKYGADEVVVTSDDAQLEKWANQVDFILDTIPAQHDINAFFNLLKFEATLSQVGLPQEPLDVSLYPFVFKRVKLTGSLIGGIKETQEMLDFCAQHKIEADIDLIQPSKINQALDNLATGTTSHRFVIDWQNPS